MFLDEFADKFASPKKLEEEVLQLPLSFEYWKNVLFEKCIRIFEWTGLPFEQKELEMRVNSALKSNDVKTAKKLCEQLEEIIMKMQGA